MRYTVPEYQRPYLWEPKFVWKLLNDMWEAYLGKDKFAGDFKFLGIIITSLLEMRRGSLWIKCRHYHCGKLCSKCQAKSF